MIKYAIVGNIASGKSEMEKYIEKKGFVVFNTDFMTHDILTDRPEVAKAFTDYDVFEYGKLSKDKLAKLVFAEPDLKKKLEEIVHPLILSEIEQIFKVYSDEKAVFISVPLLFEVGWEKYFDKIIFIKSDDKTRLNRLMKRNGYNREYAKQRIDAQMSQNNKCEKSDYVIENNGTKDEFTVKIDEFIKSNLL